MRIVGLTLAILVCIMVHDVTAVPRITDPATLGAAADDYGHTVHYFPSAVVKPTSDLEVKYAILSARLKHEQITVRGQGHSTAGQSQCCGCVVMDMSEMNAVREVGADYIYVEAGAQFQVIYDYLFPLNKTTISQTDWPGLSIGGVLSGAGGFGPSLFQKGRIAEQVLEITIVTGRGDIKVASPSQNSELFNAAINGMGQFGVITAVKFPVVDFPGSRVRIYNVYQAVDKLFANYSTIYADPDATPFQQFETFPVLNFPGTGAGLNPAYDGYFSGLPGLWVNIQEYGVFYNPGDEPNDAELLNYFDHVPGSEQVRDFSYQEWVTRLNFVFSVLLPSADFNYAWKTPHPWFEVILPVSQAEQFIEDTFAVTTPNEAQLYSVQSIIPLQRPSNGKTFQLLPDEEDLVYFGFLRQVDIASVETLYGDSIRQYDFNGDLRRDAEAIGGKPMITSTLPADADEWRDVYGDSTYAQLIWLKAKYDPWRTLGNSYRLFTWQIDPCLRNGKESTFRGTF